MRNIVLSLLVLFVASSFTKDTKGSLRAYQDQKFTWYGVDFRLARFIGPDGFKNPEGIKQDAMPKWNRIFVTEQDKYDIKKALKVKDYGYKIEWMMGVNEELDVAAAIQLDSYAITPEQIRNHIAGYHGVEGDGVGIAFVVESFNKIEKTGFIWVVFFDEKSKEVILTERLAGEPSGLSFANYWCGSIHDVINIIKSRKRKQWFRK